MGIPYFFSYIKRQFPQAITCLKQNEVFANEVNNLLIDMNGIIHSSAQKIYEYGNNKPKTRFLKKSVPKRYNLNHQLKLFEDICFTVENILYTVNPTNKLIICIDGPAPRSKQNHQRGRRFKSAMNKTEEELSFGHFDQNSITPGTKFMDYLSKYLDYYIKKRMSEDVRWMSLDVIFSNEKAPGEGEAKAISYIRRYGNTSESYCIHGLDADLIMLALSTHINNFYILRDDIYNYSNKFICVSISQIIDQLTDILRWESNQYTFDQECAINDFIFLCFMVGNDFLPHIPSLEIIENGVEVIINVYRDVGRFYGHITRKVNGKVQFIPGPLEIFLGTIAHFEKQILEDKLNKKGVYFPNQILENCSTLNEGKYKLDIERYRREYCENHFNSDSIENVCHKYFEGLQWVISYYTSGVPNWEWQFPYHYAPSASILAQHLSSFTFSEYEETRPYLPYQQLLSVLPPKSANLIPKPLNRLLLDNNSPLKVFCPDIFNIDLSGKKNDWEGIVILPILNIEIMKKAYFDKIERVDRKELIRNVIGRTNVYTFTQNSNGVFRSYYGDIQDCYVNVNQIDL